MEQVEESLGKIVSNTSQKNSHLLTVVGEGSRIEYKFEPEITAPEGCKYEIAFASMETYYSIPNITPGNNNFTIQKSGKDAKTFSLETGCYGLLDLNKEISIILKDNDMEGAIKLEPVYALLKCAMTVKKGYTVKFGEHSLRKILGFEAGKAYKSLVKDKRFVSEHIVKILTVNSIMVHCDLVEGSYLNGKKASIIYSFFPTAEPGFKIVKEPKQYIYLPVVSDVIRQMSVWVTDQYQNDLELLEENITIKFHLKSC